MNKVAAFALWRKNSILSMSEKMFCPPQPLRFWITPAYAGKRIKLRKRHSICGDHPRVCGEKLAAKAGSINGMGSPPRMRGKAAVLAQRLPGLGITPACAGKSIPAGQDTAEPRDHPRLCGEKIPVCVAVACTWGLPPRMRGKDSVIGEVVRGVGITPACAGKRP